MLLFETVWVSLVVGADGLWPPKTLRGASGSMDTQPFHSHITQTSSIPQWEKKEKKKKKEWVL